ncbi:MAG: type IV secretory system conjugative DNA transfer family protein [Peptococcaceae bacterium]|nr:type IV secretory system conjugative DNA transfer family protein [Peptococcaceae bacterium]
MEMFKTLIKNKAAKMSLVLVLAYILDAWMLGSLAVMLHDFNRGLALYNNPLLAAIKVPFSGVSSTWLFLNILAAMFLGALFFFVYVRFPEVIERFRPKKLNFIDDPSGGTSKWMPPEDIPKTFELGHGPGILLGSYECTPLRLYQKGRLNHNVMIFGAPSCGKTVSEIIPNCLQAIINEESVVITDPKGEIARETLVLYQNEGYNVKVFNLVNMLHSDRWNPLDEVANDLDAQLFTQVVIANTAVPGIKKMGGDPFWDRAEQNLLKALTMYVKYERPKERQNVPEIYKLLATDLDMLDITFKGLPEDHPAKAPYNIFSQAKAKADIIQGLAIRLQVFQNEQVKKLTEASDIDLEAPGKEKCAYFCVVSDTDSTFDFLSSLFFTFLFIKLTKLGDKSGGKCPVSINFLLDEFCNIGAIPDFKKRIATMRSRGISCTIITQSLPQLRNRYPMDEWQEIISCCDSRLFLGTNDNDTAKYLCESLDEGTIEQRSITRDTKDPLHTRFTKSPRSRSLMTPGETLRMDEKEAVLIVRGRDPLKIQKLSYSEHPLAGRLIPREVTEYKPSWHEEPLPEIEIEWGSMKSPEETDEMAGKEKVDDDDLEAIVAAIEEVQPGASKEKHFQLGDSGEELPEPETITFHERGEVDINNVIQQPTKGWF